MSDLENIDFIIGFDLGHAETSVSSINLKSKDNSPQAIEILGKKLSFTTAIGYHPKEGIYIGDESITLPGVKDLYISFKRRPVDDNNYQKIMHDYINYIYKRMKDGKHGFRDDNIYVYAGCPTDWYRHNELIEKYKNIFINAEIKNVRIVAESRGALMSIYDKTTIGDQRGRALIIDIGSSTTDFSFVDMSLYYSDPDPVDFGCDLGGSIIDRLIFRDILNNHKQKEKLISIFKEDHTKKYLCELKCRENKERWFDSPRSIQDIFVPIIPDKLYFNGNISSEYMEKILEEPINDLNDMEIYDNNYICNDSWPQEFEKQLSRAKEHGTPDIIVLTGGASRMPFVIPICEKIFPYMKDKIFRDLQPELSISKGLAIWGYTDFTSQKFESEVKQVLDTYLKKAIEKDLDKAFEKIAKDMIDDAMGNVIIPNVKSWQITSDSISMLQKDLEIKLREWNKSDRVINLVNREFAQYLVLVTKDINKDYLIDIAKKYKILNPDTVLDTSNRIEDIFTDIELFKGNPLEQALEKIKQEFINEFNAIIVLIGGLIIAALWFVGIGIIITILIGIYTLKYGSEKAQQMVNDVEIPSWLKTDMVDKLNNKKPEITEKVLTDLKKNTVIKSDIISAGKQVIEIVTNDQAREMRRLLGR